MPNIHNSDWDEQVGACVKHCIPMTPCPQCIAEQDPGIQVTLTEADRTQMDWDPDFKIVDMFPADQAWLVKRII